MIRSAIPSLAAESAPDYGYLFTIAENANLVTDHKESIIGLSFGQTYFVRPVSRVGSAEIVGNELSFSTLPASQCVLGEAGEPELQITKNFVLAETDAGARNVEFRITVRNAGNLTAFNAVLADQLPDGFVFSDDQQDARLLGLGDLEPGQSESFSWFADIDSQVLAGTYVNKAEVSADNADTKTAEDSIIVRKQEVLAESGFSTSEFGLLLFGLMGTAGASVWLRRRESVLG
jgi:hypothetical protein